MVAVALVGVSCGRGGRGDDPPRLANPASVFCEEQGGRVELERDEAGNEQGICVLPDGLRVDE
jgi:putative hemolysin